MTMAKDPNNIDSAMSNHSGSSDSWRKLPSARPSLLKPAALRAGDTIGICSPASRPASRAIAARAERFFSSLDLKVKFANHAFDARGHCAGADQERVSDLNLFIRDPDIRGIVFLAGGFGSIRLLHDLDIDGIRRDPKVMIGADDLTALLIAIHSRTGLVVFHGANLDSIDLGFSSHEFKRLFNSASCDKTISHEAKINEVCKSSPSFMASRLEESANSHSDNLELDTDISAFWNCINIEDPGSSLQWSPVSGRVDGPLIGGNIAALSSLNGTGYDIDLDGAILFVEEINERLDILDRWFTNLFVSGRLAKLGGFILGRLDGCKTAGMKNMLSIEDFWSPRLSSLEIPSIFGFPIGQSGQCPIVPIGINARLDSHSGTLAFLESPFS